MSRHRLEPQFFDDKLPVVARKHIRLAGRAFPIGQTINWRSMGVSARKMRTLHAGGFVTHEDLVAETSTKPEPVAPSTEAPSDDFDMEGLDDPESDSLTIDQDLLDITKLKPLQAIAEEMGVEQVRSKEEQRELIQLARNGSAS